jgi:hypothetical protein
MADDPARENKTERVHFLMSPSEVKAIDDWSFSHRVRTRGGAIRRLVARGLAYETAQEALTAADAVINELVECYELVKARIPRELIERYLEARLESLDSTEIRLQIEALQQRKKL